MLYADGVDAAAANREYSGKKVPAAPCGRYGATAVVYKQQIWLFGGTDGGFSKKGLDKSKSGNEHLVNLVPAMCSRHHCPSADASAAWPVMRHALKCTNRSFAMACCGTLVLADRLKAVTMHVHRS